MALSSAGIGSGLPIENIITQLMSFEQRPLTLLDQKVAGFQAKLSAMGTLKSAFATFQTAAQGLSDIAKFQALSTTVGDAAVATATAGSSAAPGNYSLEVSSLAQAQKLASKGQASSTAQLGGGTISFDLGTISGGSFDSATGQYTGASFASSGAGVKTVTIDPTNSSLAGIRDAINKAGVGVTASLVNDGSATPYRLVLTETATGKASSMKISVDGDAGLQGLLSHDPAGAQAMTETVKAQNAEFKLDGLAISSATNKVANVIDGVTLNLAKTNAGTPTTVAVTRDTKSVTESVGKFVSAFNAINKTMNELTSYNPTTKKGAVLNGDATVRSMQTQLRSLLGSPVANGGGTAFTMLSDIGVTVKAGVMAVDDAKLQKAIDSNFNGIAGLFASTGKPSDSLVSFAGATANTVPGEYAVQVTQPATQGSLAATAASTLALDGSNNMLDVTLNGVTVSIALEARSYASAADLATEIQSKINGDAAFSAAGAKVAVTESGGQIEVSSARWGAASGVGFGGPAAAALFSSVSATQGKNVAGTIGGSPATGSGRTLTADAGSPAEGLALQIDGASGARGTVAYAKGYAAQFEQLATTLLDSSKGPFASRTEGINASIKSLTDNRVRMQDRLAATEQRLRAQYTALDATVARMNSTSSYLAQQLTALSNMTR